MNLTIEEMQIYKKIGRNIKHYRIKRGLSQLDLATMVGISQAYIGKIEKGERRVPISLLIKISEALNVSLDDLISNMPIHKLEEESSDLSSEEMVKKILLKYPKSKRIKILKEALETLAT